jgi:hypothetical protein
VAVLAVQGGAQSEYGRQTQLAVRSGASPAAAEERVKQKAISQQQKQRAQFDAIVEANRLKKQKELERQNKRAQTPAPAVKKEQAQAKRELSKALLQQQAQRKAFEAQVEANRKKKEKLLAINNKRYAKGLPPLQAETLRATTPVRDSAPSKPAPVRRTASPARPSAAPAARQRVSSAQKTSEESPAQAFERIFAPIFIPPAVAKKRPELVQKYQASTPKTSAGVTKSRVTKPRVTKPRVTKTVAKKPSTSTRGVVKPTRVTTRAGTRAGTRVTTRARTTGKGVVKPTRVVKRASETTTKESPSKFFDSIFAKK